MNVSNFYFLLILLLTVLLSINSTSLKDDDKLYLVHVEYGYNISNFTCEVLNRDDAEINEFLSSRIAFMNGSDYDKEIFDLYSPYMNKFWLFLVNSSEVANSLLEKDNYEKDELYINGIIIPESLNYTMPEKNNNKKIPIFIVKDDLTEKLHAYDIRYMNKHIYFLFEIKRAISSYPETYLLILSILFTLCGIGLFAFYKIKTKNLEAANLLNIQRIMNCPIIILVLLGILFIVKSVLIRGEDPNKESPDSVYIDVALITFSAVFKTILWLSVLFLSFGMSISIEKLNPKTVKFIIKMVLGIYIIMCLDQLFDSFVEKAWVFHLSEIKNVLFLIGIMIYLYKRINKTIRFLERKLYYARALSLEYIDVLKFKIKLIKLLFRVLYSYAALYLVILILHKTVVYPYDTKVLEMYDYMLADIYLYAILLYTYRPRVLPQDFKMDIGDEDEDEIGLVYKAFLPKYSIINVKFKENYKDIYSVKGKNIPILVLGPCLSHINAENDQEISINNYINNVEIGFAT